MQADEAECNIDNCDCQHSFNHLTLSSSFHWPPTNARANQISPWTILRREDLSPFGSCRSCLIWRPWGKHPLHMFSTFLGIFSRVTCQEWPSRIWIRQFWHVSGYLTSDVTGSPRRQDGCTLKRLISGANEDDSPSERERGAIGGSAWQNQGMLKHCLPLM